VVDVWDAVLSDRHSRDAWPEEKALQYLWEQSGKHFDPSTVEVFWKMVIKEKKKTFENLYRRRGCLQKPDN
jgi:HD-GYP domain-containing protein (c-di-GMP phosphodiesterase class II)